MASFPLIAHAHGEAVLAYRAGAPVSARQFLAEVDSLRRRLPAATHVLNMCTDRYRFSVGLAACLLAKKVSLLPSTHTPTVIRELRAFAPDTLCLTDTPRPELDLPQFNYGANCAQAAPDDTRAPWSVPEIAAEQPAAYVFTSGSTGTPVPHRKSWGRLVRCVQSESARLGFAALGRCAVLATVPPQHMYGFESTVLLPLQSGTALVAERPFFPADICNALAALPRPRVLVTTPVHLRALLGVDITPPALDLIVSATALLPQHLARAAEARCGARLLEIYGCTETGQIATRRTAAETEWRLWPGVHLRTEGTQCWIEGGHLEQPNLMNDILEPRSRERFLLHGRTADLVNIAGKRSSLAYLNHQLNAIPGVVDGEFYLREDAQTSIAGVTRLGALVVAPHLSAGAITQQLRERIDPVFLPRPLLLVAELPRNATGKVSREALQALQASIEERDCSLPEPVE
ncbi:MAG: AMP-binding protein [Steroidobacterales bacterium]